MPRPASKQEAFAANLGGTALGTAVYQPVKMRDKSGRVGDIAFFNNVGKYVWLRNAFDTPVISTLPSRNSNSDNRGLDNGTGEYFLFRKRRLSWRRSRGISKLPLVGKLN